MLVREILQEGNEWFGEFTYQYGRQKDIVVFKLTENMDKVHYVFPWELADILKLVSNKSKEDLEVVDLIQGVTLRWNGASDGFQVVRSDDELDFTFGYSLSPVVEWLRLAKRTMIEREFVMGQAFGEIEIPKEVMMDCYDPVDYKTERGSQRWLR